MIQETQGPTLAATVSKILDDTQTLARQELGLVRMQFYETTKKGLKAASGLVLGAASALLGTIALSFAVVLLLRRAGIPVGVGCLIVAAVYFIFSFFAARKFLKLGKEIDSDFYPKNPINAQQENVRWLKK